MGGGFTILEALIAAVIISASLGALALLSTSQWANSKDVDILNRAENAIARDLGWLKSYAKYWRMTSGPYNFTATQTGASSYTLSRNTIEYQPDRSDVTPAETRCSTSSTSMAQAFISDASSDAAGTAFNPNRPFNLSTSAATTLTPTGLPAGLSLRRTIAFSKTVNSTDISTRNTVYITYTLDDGSGSSAYRLIREVALRPEAADWCP